MGRFWPFMILLPCVGLLYGCSASRPPQLQNLGLALDVSKFNPIPREAFFEFYGRIGDPNTGKRIPNFEYRVLQSVEIIAPTAGTIEVRETGIDQAINLDHLTQLRVATGDHVEAGQVVASPGVWSNSLGGGKQYCPTALLAPQVAENLKAQVNALMAALESSAGDSTLFDEAAMIQPGCYVESFLFQE